MNFMNPGFFWLLLLLPLYGGWWWLRKKGPAVKMANLRGLKKAQPRSLWRWLPLMQMMMAVVVMVLMVVVLARPQKEDQVEEVTKNGIDMVLALDVSGSMMAEDLKPNRIEAAKESIGEFIDSRENDRMGVVIFAGKAFTQSPLTFDYDILQEYLAQTSTETVDQRVRGLSGTAIGDAVLAAVSRFQDDEERSKVLILATDGDANTGVDPVLAAQKAADEGIKIYTIGIGSEEGAYIPTVDALGRKTYMQDERGEPLKATFNEEALKELAAIGGGKYFRAGDNESFDQVLREIDSLERRDLAVSSITEYEDNHKEFLTVLVMVFLGYLVLLAIRPIVR